MSKNSTPYILPSFTLSKVNFVRFRVPSSAHVVGGPPCTILRVQIWGPSPPAREVESSGRPGFKASSCPSPQPNQRHSSQSPHSHALHYATPNPTHLGLQWRRHPAPAAAAPWPPGPPPSSTRRSGGVLQGRRHGCGGGASSAGPPPPALHALLGALWVPRPLHRQRRRALRTPGWRLPAERRPVPRLPGVRARHRPRLPARAERPTPPRGQGGGR